MATIGDLVVNFGANSRQFDRKSRAMRSSLQSLSSFALRVAGPVAAVFGTRESINAAREQIASERKLEAVIKSTGGAAGLTAKEIQDYASQLRRSQTSVTKRQFQQRQCSPRSSKSKARHLPKRLR